MAITNPEAIKFSNEQLRRISDMQAQLYYAQKALVDEWNATSMSSLITNTSDVLRDSSSPSDDVGTGGDGRHVVTGINLTAIVTRASENITDMEATNNAKLNTILAVATNPTRVS